MRYLLLAFCFTSSFAQARFLNQIAGQYLSIPGIPDECEKDNIVVRCDNQIGSMEIKIVNEQKKEFSVVVNNDPLHPLSVGCGNYDEPEGSDLISHAAVMQTDDMIVCVWITNSAPYLPSMRKIEFKRFNELVIEYRIINEYKGNTFPMGKFYWQNGVSSSLRKQ